MGARTLLSRFKSRLRGRATKHNSQLASLQKQLVAKSRRAAQVGKEFVQKSFGEPSGGVEPENIVWIFGSPRTGSTWLSRTMGELEGHTVWREPLVGALFGNLYYDRAKHLVGKTGKHYIL